MAFLLRAITLTGLLACAITARAEQPVRVFAAASLTDALTDVGALWKKEGHAAPAFTFAASSSLAQQLEAGAHADIFASADLRWTNYLDRAGRIDTASRRNFLSNRLVLIVPKGKGFHVEMKQGFDFAGAFSGKLCTGLPSTVPVGVYAKQSLQTLNWFGGLSGRIVGADNVRVALSMVEGGECAAGIVYATDAALSHKVEILSGFPESTHDPIVYPFSLVNGAGPDAKAFLEFVGSAPARGVFTRYGFLAAKS